jgi:hypothetical protein
LYHSHIVLTCSRAAIELHLPARLIRINRPASQILFRRRLCFAVLLRGIGPSPVFRSSPPKTDSAFLSPESPY